MEQGTAWVVLPGVPLPTWASAKMTSTLLASCSQRSSMYWLCVVGQYGCRGARTVALACYWRGLCQGQCT